MTRLSPQSGTAFVLHAGDTLRVTDPEGEQVADLIAFSREPRPAWLSSGRTFDYNDTLYLSTGHVLYSNRSTSMLTITADTVGRHDFLYTPCSRETFRLLYGQTGHHPSCLDNLAASLAPYGIEADDIPTTFNIFMNVDIESDGRLRIRPPRSRPGAHIELRAEMELLIGLTACSAEMSNNYKLKPIDYEVIAAHRDGPHDAVR
jgi:uncharacterized protein YcgI (DUF1989 family)